jgi:hypothetical protein
MFTLLFWIYLINAVLIIDHEIESAYWKEWEMFKLPGKITGFVIIHFPILILIILGSTLIYTQNVLGYIMSILLSLGGLFAFSAHTYFIKKGRPEFKLPISKFMLISILMLSIVQLVVSVYSLF